MTFPVGLQTVTVNLGTYTDQGGDTAFTGHITFTPRSPRTHVATGTLLPASPIRVDVTAGVGQVVLVASDATGCDASDVQYSVVFALVGPTGERAGIPSKTIYLSASVPVVDLDAIPAVVPVTPTGVAVTGAAADSAVVHNTGDETVAGVKTFSSSPVVPTPTTSLQAATKGYVDTDAWATSWALAAFDLAPAENQPVITWTSVETSALSSPVAYYPQKVNIGSTTSNWDGLSDTVFRYHSGIFQTLNGGQGDYALYGQTKPGGGAQAARWPLVWSFVTAAAVAVVEMSFYPLGGVVPELLIEVDGKLIADITIQKNPATTGANSVTMTFPSARARTIKVWAEGPIGLRAVRVPTGQSITKPAATIKRRVAFIGDSYVNGSGASHSATQGASNRETFAARLGRLMATDDMISAGIGSTGWVAGMDGATPNPFSTRLTAVLAMSPHVIVFYGSINDGAAGTGVQAAVEATLATCAAVPKIYVIGPLLNGYSAANAAVKAGTLAGGRTFIDLGDFLFGTGKVDNPTGDGNRDVFLMPDATHPTFAAHKAIARAAYSLIARTW